MKRLREEEAGGRAGAEVSPRRAKGPKQDPARPPPRKGGRLWDPDGDEDNDARMRTRTWVTTLAGGRSSQRERG